MSGVNELTVPRIGPPPEPAALVIRIRPSRGWVSLALGFVVLAGFMAWYIQRGEVAVPGAQLLWLPLFLLLALATSLGTGLWLSALNVRFRDVRYVVPFLSQIWMFATPIAYPS